MLGDIKGFAHIKNETKSIISPAPSSDFEGEIVRVIDWAVDDSSALCINPKGTAIGDIPMEDICRSFRCGSQGPVLTPPGASITEQIFYTTKVLRRKGGYNSILKRLVVAASLSKGKFDDSILF